MLSWTNDPSTTDIVAGGHWDLAGTSFYYQVTRPEEESEPLHYLYAFSVTCNPDLSHFILQVSPAVADGLPAFDPYNPTDYLGGPTVEGQATSCGPHPGNPGFPVGQNIWGIKFEDDIPSLWTIEFDSYRLPMWGDFYAKGGVDSFAYNSGLGSLEGANIPVPDSLYVPVPGAVLLGMLGLGAAGLRLRRFA